MKRLQLIKTSAEVEAAHLYEHLFINSLMKLFRANGLLNYLDFRFDARSYQGGFIFINVLLISKNAQNLTDKIESLEIDVSESAISNAITQITAEKGIKFGGDPRKLIEYLKLLSRQEWVKPAEFGLMDAAQIRRSRRSFWPTDKKARTARVRCSIVLDKKFAKSHRHLLPLFAIVADAVLDNVTMSLLDDLNGYTKFLETAAYDRKFVESVDIYFEQAYFDWRKVVRNCEDTSISICGKLPSILPGWLRNYDFLPDITDVFEKSQILIGEAGWNNIGTSDNINLLIRNSLLRIESGDQNIKIKFKK